MEANKDILNTIICQMSVIYSAACQVLKIGGVCVCHETDW